MTKTTSGWKHWTKHRAYETALAGMVVFLFSSFASQVNTRGGRAVPAESWLQVHEVLVPDHRVGENPDVLFDRTVLATFSGFSVAEVQLGRDDGLWETACSGSEAREYIAGEPTSNRIMAWSDFLHRRCNVPAGVYRVRLSYEIKNAEVAAKVIVITSNTFRVTE